MTDSRPEIKSEATADGEFVRLKMSKRHEGFPAVEYEFVLSKAEAIELMMRLAKANQTPITMYAMSISYGNTFENCTSRNAEPQGPRLAEKTWRDREPML